MSTTTPKCRMATELNHRMAQRATGVLFVTTHQRRALSLALTDGHITYCAGARTHGLEAVAALVDADVASFAFTLNGDYPFRSRDEVVHEHARLRLQPLFERAAELAAAQAGNAAVQQDSIDGDAQQVTTRVYRGQLVVTSSPADAAEASPPAPPKRSGTVRYYRGQRIED